MANLKDNKRDRIEDRAVPPAIDVQAGAFIDGGVVRSMGDTPGYRDLML